MPATSNLVIRKQIPVVVKVSFSKTSLVNPPVVRLTNAGLLWRAINVHDHLMTGGSELHSHLVPEATNLVYSPLSMECGSSAGVVVEVDD
ncbi:hypothetical protein CDAR_370661 [Caerostris darwini]|uniref:Uncharacterized protein n=1 Tax=Caerostris darwini TaxID=1538125 RepID=A0AAV4VFN5_9ARAC|nr:hypothetical protein CDAR_370661 [Caerostris darwini]